MKREFVLHVIYDDKENLLKVIDKVREDLVNGLEKTESEFMQCCDCEHHYFTKTAYDSSFCEEARPCECGAIPNWRRTDGWLMECKECGRHGYINPTPGRAIAEWNRLRYWENPNKEGEK